MRTTRRPVDHKIELEPEALHKLTDNAHSMSSCDDEI